MTQIRIVLVMVGTLSLYAAQALAADVHARREHGVHQHGHAAMNIAIEDKRVEIELRAPGADIVGFEHKAKTKAQKAAVAAAVRTLKQIKNVIDLTGAAGCKTTKAKVEQHREHGNDAHGEFHVTYQLSCASPVHLDKLAFPYFKSFAGAEKLGVNVIGGKGQKSFEVQRSAPQISLSGLI